MTQETQALHTVPQQANNTFTLRVPKPNIQIIILGIVALITVLQTVQLLRISSAANTVSVSPAANAGGAGTGGNAAPQSMVGGC